MPKYKILNEDFRKVMNPEAPLLMPVDTIFADPPDNIGLDYDEYEDKMTEGEYRDFLQQLFHACWTAARTSYISFNAQWMTMVGGILDEMKYDGWYDEDEGDEVRWLIQGFTFGQHRKTDYGNDFRPIIRLRHRDAPLFPNAVRRESWRMKNGDKRANPAGRVPGDVWFTDFLQYARVTGNSKQRRRWHETQLHEGLVEDCLTMSTPPGGTVIDPFCGTGTTLRICIANGWSCTTMDISENYCQRTASENHIQKIEEGLWVRTEQKSN